MGEDEHDREKRDFSGLRKGEVNSSSEALCVINFKMKIYGSNK